MFFTHSLPLMLRLFKNAINILILRNSYAPIFCNPVKTNSHFITEVAIVLSILKTCKRVLQMPHHIHILILPDILF